MLGGHRIEDCKILPDGTVLGPDGTKIGIVEISKALQKQRPRRRAVSRSPAGVGDGGDGAGGL